MTDIVAKAKAKNVALHLPTDFVTADSFSADAKVGHATVAGGTGIPAGWMGLDIGPETSVALARQSAKRPIGWERAMGVFEFEAFASGTKAVMDAVVAVTERKEGEAGANSKIGGTTIIGGDTATCAEKNLAQRHSCLMSRPEEERV